MLEEFSEYLRQLGKSENTVIAYSRNIRLYITWCRSSFGEEPSLLYRANILEYISYMRNVRDYDPKTVNNHIASLKSLNEYLIGTGRQTDSVVHNSDFMKIQIRYASPCTVGKKDVEAFRQRLLESGNKRDYAIVTLYAYAGIRRSECAALKLDQVDLVSKEIYIVGKGNKHRVVYINDKIVFAIREYLKEHRSDSPYLFISRQNKKMSPSRINQIFNRYSDVITPKTLRHYFCSNALENGYSIHEVANQAGHSNVQTTLIYSNPTAQEMKDKANRL
ncbi:MAG: tyrosine-type recombinase/integrase [Oscillospiraceae bacterium]